MKLSPICLVAPFVLLLSACAPFQPTDAHAGYCNELNSRIIFSGSTTIQRDAEIQNAQQPQMQRSYDKRCT